MRFYQASTSMYGKLEQYLKKKIQFFPRSPYGVSKFMLTGLQKIIVNLLTFLVQQEYCLIMNHQEEVKTLLLEKSLKVKKLKMGRKIHH